MSHHTVSGFCVTQHYIFRQPENAEYFSTEKILSPKEIHADFSIWYFEIKVIAAVKNFLLDEECCLFRQHWSLLLETFLDSYVIL